MEDLIKKLSSLFKDFSNKEITIPNWKVIKEKFIDFKETILAFYSNMSDKDKDMPN